MNEIKLIENGVAPGAGAVGSLFAEWVQLAHQRRFGGNSGFSSGYTFWPTPGGGNLDAGYYAVGTNPSAYHVVFENFGAPGGGNMMIINGAGTPNTAFWSQTIAVTANTEYYFSTQVASACCTSDLAVLQFSINGSQVGSTFTAPSTAGVWQQFFTTWNSGSNTTATLSILNQNTTLGGNDFAVTQLAFDSTAPGGGLNVSSVPEPGSAILLGSSMCALIRLRWGRQLRLAALPRRPSIT